MRITFDNYKDQYKGYSLDIQDEVRSAIFDGLVDALKPYIEKYKDVPFMVNQIRLAMLEGLPQGYYNVGYGSVLYRIRKGKQGVDYTPICNIRKGLSESSLNSVLDWIELGADITKFNIERLPIGVYPTITKGLQKGVDMSIFANGKEFTDEYVSLVSNIRDTGVQVDRFTNTIWPIETVKLLSSISSRYPKVYTEVMQNITEYSKMDYVESLISAARNGIPLESINALLPFQINWIVEAAQEGLEWSQLVDPNLSNDELSACLDEMRLKSINKTIRRPL